MANGEEKGRRNRDEPPKSTLRDLERRTVVYLSIPLYTVLLGHYIRCDIYGNRYYISVCPVIRYTGATLPIPPLVTDACSE